MIQTQFHSTRAPKAGRPKSCSGFTLIELMVAMTIFLIIGGAAMSLFKSHADLFATQQGEVGLNMTLRNALAQIQTDAVQAGNGFFGSLSTANTPAGITITNNAGPLDSFYMIQAAIPSGGVPIGGTGCIATTSGTVTLAATPGITTANFPVGTFILFMNGAGTQMTIAKVSGATGTTAVTLTYGSTSNNGTNNNANDIFGLTWTVPPPPNVNPLSDTFCQSTGDYVVALSWVRYAVNAQNQLIRTSSANANQDVIAEQIIGFKVGAATFQNVGTSTSTPAYSFDATSYSSQFNLIRSIRVSLIGRTTPGQFTGSTFRNSFDGGQYRIQALSLVINPRNLSMND